MSGKKITIENSHPEAVNNGRGYFNYEKDPIPAERVDRGDEYELRPNPYQLTDKDLTKIAANAVTLLDKTMLATDRQAAMQDALISACKSFDGGKYDGKVSYNTGTVILALMEKLAPKGKTAAEEKKEAPAKAEAPVIFQDGKAVRIGPGNKAKDLSRAQQSKALRTMNPTQRAKAVGSPKEAACEIMDRVASELEASGNPELVKLALEIDSLTNSIERGEEI